MIKIDSTNPRKEDNSRIKSKISHRITRKESFESVLNSKINFEFEGAIDDLLNDLKEEEERFLKDQSLYQLKKYKSIVEKILKKILDEGFETLKLKRLKRNKADFIIINKINSRLLDITREITAKNNKAFNLLSAIEEIRGMILDLLF